MIQHAEMYISMQDHENHIIRIFRGLWGCAGFFAGARPGFALEHTYPNSLNSSTTVRFLIERAKAVTLTVYDVLGRRSARWRTGCSRRAAAASRSMERVWQGVRTCTSCVPGKTSL